MYILTLEVVGMAPSVPGAVSGEEGAAAERWQAEPGASSNGSVKDNFATYGHEQ